MTWRNPPQNMTLQLLSEADTRTKKITGEMLQQVVVRSPVDSGAFRQNHRVSIGSVDKSFDVNDTGNDALSKGIRTIQAGGGLGKIVHVSNSLPYALRLENGWSGQAPQGVYSLAFLSVVSKYK
jgi:hypothetical protein